VRRAGLAADAGAGAEVDDAAPAVPEVPECRLIGVERPFHVHVEDQVPLVVGDVLGRCAALDTSDVGHGIEPAEQADGALECVEHLAPVGDIATDERRGASHLLRHRRAVVDIERHHARALAHIGPHRGRTDAAGAAGDDDAFVLEQHGRI
jgi:hypothetical protein